MADGDSWLSQLWDWGTGDETDIGTVVTSHDENTQHGDGFFGSTNFYNSLLTAGLGLAGTYYKQTGDKQLAEEAAKQRMAEIDANKEEAAAGLAAKLKAAKIAAAAQVKAARIATLGGLYQNYGSVVERGGEAQGQSALDTGKNMEAPIITRAGRL